MELLRALPSIPARLGLTIEYESRRFTGVLLLEDEDFLGRLLGVLRGCLGCPLHEIGSLEVEA